MALDVKMRNQDDDHSSEKSEGSRKAGPTLAPVINDERGEAADASGVARANEAEGRKEARDDRQRVEDKSKEPDTEGKSKNDEPHENRDEKDTAPQKSFFQTHRRGVFIGGIALVVVLAGSFVYWDHSRHFQSTDDAFVAARQYSVAPKVSGYITAVPVTDNQHVAAGEVIAIIDQRDYKIALDQAQAQVAGAEASIKNIDAQLEVQQSQIDSSRAQVDQAQAGLTFAQQQAKRYEDLLKTGSGTVQNAQQFSSQQKQAEATLTSAQASLKVAQGTMDSLKAQRESARANLAQNQAQRDQAQLNLNYTTVTAAQSGRVTNLTGAVGQFASAGTAMSMFVPDDIWVTANYKETQLDQMRPNQPVTLKIDAYPGRVIQGHVDSVQSGSGTAFSLLPAENATGNYVKIVQRVPVKLVMDNPPADVALGPGMSVVPTVRVNMNPSFYERMRSAL